ncbi:MAG TPA: metallophosphoesterase [Alphaproteobacteria bacterium]|nr:metallophosphoesterase [Alphaproteobacteria bacterium]
MKKDSLAHQFVTFFPILSAFLAIFTLMNYYVLSTHYIFFGLEKTNLFFLLLFLFSASFLISSIAELIGNNILFRTMYILSSVLMGTLFISFFITLFYDLLEFILPFDEVIFGILSIFTITILAIYSITVNYRICVKTVPIHNNKNVEMRIVQITDIHLGPIYGESWLKAIVKKVNTLNPDLVLMTGDLLDGRYKYKADLLKPLDDIKSDVYFVYGNHDAYAGLDRLEKLLSQTKIRWLRNESVQYENIDIIGFDDTSEERHVGGMLYAMNMHKKIGDRFTILMTHRPVGWREAAKYVDLMIAGHTHAGQLWPFNYLALWQNTACKGIYRCNTNNRFMLYVSCGTGTWGPPMRLGSSTEITVFDLKRENYK